MVDELEVGATLDALVPNTVGEFPFGGLADVLIASRLQDKPLPIYAIADGAGQTAVPARLGSPAEKLNDDRLGAMLDALRPHGEAMWARVVGQAVRRFGLDLSTLQADPTKIAFEGRYPGWEDLPPDVPRIPYGKPKDGQVDRKLVTWSHWVSPDGGVPVWLGRAVGKNGRSPGLLPTGARPHATGAGAAVS